MNLLNSKIYLFDTKICAFDTENDAFSTGIDAFDTSGGGIAVARLRIAKAKTGLPATGKPHEAAKQRLTEARHALHLHFSHLTTP